DDCERDGGPRYGFQLSADRLEHREPHAGDVRVDGAGQERVLRRGRGELERAVASARRAVHGHDRPDRGLLRLAAADRLSPGGSGVCAASATPTAAAAATTPAAAGARS